MFLNMVGVCFFFLGERVRERRENVEGFESGDGERDGKGLL